MDEQARLQLQGQLDQFGALLRDIAPVIVGYWRALVGQGIPQDVATLLTSQLHDEFLARLFTPGDQEAR